MATIKISGMRCGHGAASDNENTPMALKIIKDAIGKLGFE